MMLRRLRVVPEQVLRLVRNEAGGAAAELAIWATVIIVSLLGAADVAFYTYKSMQVGIAAQAGVQAAWAACDTAAKQPAVQRCTGVATTINTAVQSTSLGTSVVVASGSTVEGYYCVNGSGALTLVGSSGGVGGTPTPPTPFTCAAAGGSALTKPGDYLRIQVNYTFTPTFSGVPVTLVLPATISRTAWVRIG